jgi:hypothetical protein
MTAISQRQKPLVYSTRLLPNRGMDSSEHLGGLATAPTLHQGSWKTYTILTVNPLDDAVVLWKLRARSQQEAWEKADAASHTFDTNLVFDEQRFRSLVAEVDKLKAHGR